MSPLRRLALVALLGLGGCAGKETQASRDAWHRAVRSDTAGGAAGGGAGGSKSGGTLADPSAWRDMVAFTNTTGDLLALGISTAPLTTLVDKLCSEPPDEPEGVLQPDVVRCAPKPAMEPLGHPLMLELGRGSVGLVAPDLTDKDSADLVVLALKQMASACAGAWTRVAGGNHEEFHTCAAPSGAMLVLGRFTGEGTGDRWQFSLAVLGPG